MCAVALAGPGCFGLSLGDEPFVCGTGGLCPSGYECLFNVCTRIGKPDAATPDGGPTVIDATCAADDFIGCVDGTHARVCNDDGTGILEVACPGGCDASAQLCVRCTPNTVSCEGDTLVTCGPLGDVDDTQHCFAGCDPTPPATCFRLVPHNLPADACAPAEADDLVLSQDREIDTASCVALGGELRSQGNGTTDPAPICYLKVRSVLLELGVRLKISGPYPLALVALERIELRGTVDASGDGPLPGPGPSSKGIGEPGGTGNDGGGGGGYLTEGAKGGPGQLGHHQAKGGASQGDDTLSPLSGGAPGGGGGIPCVLDPCPVGEDAPGGGGGGALQLVACEELVIGQLSRINAGGGGGPGGPPTGILGAPGGGSGGGTGGTIFLEAPSITIPNGAKATAPGGGGGGGGAQASGDAGGDADDELPGVGGTAPLGAGAGGQGGAGQVVTPHNGKAARDTGQDGGGGGGGSAGRIRANARPDLPVVIAPGARVVPPAVKGTIDRQRAN